MANSSREMVRIDKYFKPRSINRFNYAITQSLEKLISCYFCVSARCFARPTFAGSYYADWRITGSSMEDYANRAWVDVYTSFVRQCYCDIWSGTGDGLPIVFDRFSMLAKVILCSDTLEILGHVFNEYGWKLYKFRYVLGIWDVI